MASSLNLFMLLALILVHESLAIKCIVQPDPEEKRKFDEHIEEVLFNVAWALQNEKKAEFKEDFLRMMRTKAVVECGEDENYNRIYKKRSAHCASLDLATCPEVPYDYGEYGVKLAELSGLFVKTCTHTPIGMESSTGHVKKRAAMNFKWNINLETYPDYVCSRYSRFRNCTHCYQCDESDTCNEGPNQKNETAWKYKEVTTMSTTTVVKMDTTTNIGIGTEKVGTTRKAESEETTVAINGASLATVGQASALFQLLLAIASCAFCWAVFR